MYNPNVGYTVMANLTPMQVAEKIGREYVEREQLPFEETQTVQRTYKRLSGVIAELYDRIPLPVEFQADDPYTDYYDMRNTVADEGVLRVYNQHTNHRYFSHEEQLQFRAVHDYHGHLAADVDFTPEGEYRKWEHMNRYFDTERQQRVMFAEVVGQVGAVHYLPDGFADDRYEQRALLAPKAWIWDMEHAVDG